MKFVGNYQEKQNFSDLEKKVLEYWDINKTFEKSISIRENSKSYRFYDGPPFATGLPHYGHLLGSTIKDVVGRYWTMKGFRVDRVWGWDCHGLPIENMVEKQLDLKGGKKGIEELGIEKFNKACKDSVLAYDKEWRSIIRRIGRWVDMEHSYKTMDNTYMESVWWAFKTLHQKGLVYEGRHVILYCPRCATPLSNFEVAMDNSYRDVEDDSIFIKFKVKGEENTYLLAWTTTPWTLPGNVGLAVKEDADYVKVKVGSEYLILAEARLSVLDGEYTIVKKMKGEELCGIAYEPLYDYLPIGDKKAYYVAKAWFVSMDDGSGIVHTASIYGEDDYKLALEIDLPTIPMLDDTGRFLPFVEIVQGKSFKQANPIILEDLKNRNLAYKIEKVTHSYPFCYRCEAPLYYSALPAWFINVQKMKDKLIAENENINWVPSHFKHGQFKNILTSSPDWNVSRNRFWGSPMPIWVCEDCGSRDIIGSVQELKERAVNPAKVDGLKDLHRPYIDEIELNCKCGHGAMKRIPEVFDCWVESASMPFAELHYPFENQDIFEQRYPADFIAEYVGQVRAWFNVLHRVAVGLFDKPSFKNVVVTGVYLGSDGKKMSKSKKNYPDPSMVFEKYGVDAVRFYMMSTTVMKGENVILLEKDVDEVYKKVMNIFWNVHSFLMMYGGKEINPSFSSKHVMDRWAASLTNTTLKKVTEFMDAYDVVSACREVQSYIDLVSTWYLRRSRERLKDDRDTVSTLAKVIEVTAQMLAPITPFMAEVVYNELKAKSSKSDDKNSDSSVHLTNWPVFDAGLIDSELEVEMEEVKKVVEIGHSERKSKEIKVRQPLSKITVSQKGLKLKDELIEILKEELNVKDVVIKQQGAQLQAELDTTITEELELEGLARDLVRSIQVLRKELGLSVHDKVNVEYESSEKLNRAVLAFEEYIKQKASVKELKSGSKLQVF